MATIIKLKTIKTMEKTLVIYVCVSTSVPGDIAGSFWDIVRVLCKALERI